MPDKQHNKGQDSATEKPGRSLNPLRRLRHFCQAFAASAQSRTAAHYLAQVLASLGKMPEGGDMLRFAAENNISIRVVPKSALAPQAAAEFFRDADGHFAVILGKSSNAGFSALSLMHELRHARQQKEWTAYGTAEEALFGRPREGYLNLMIMEADAYTWQIVTALRLQQKGAPEHLENFIGSRGKEAETARKFLKKYPFESFADEKSFSRALFTEFMTRGLHEYRGQYLRYLSRSFETLETLDKFRARVAGTPVAEELKPSAALGSLYGGSFAEALSLNALRAAFEKSLLPYERAVLRKMDIGVKRAESLSPEAYAALRKDILKSSRYCLEVLEEYTQPPHGTAAAAAAQALAGFARSERPPALAAFSAAAQNCLKNAGAPQPRVLVYRPSR